MGFDFQSSRVAEGTQEIQKVLEREASVFMFRCWEHMADSFPERVGLIRKKVQGSAQLTKTRSTSSTTILVPYVIVIMRTNNKQSTKTLHFFRFTIKQGFHLELWQSKNPVHWDSGVLMVFLIFCEQLSESLVGTKTNKTKIIQRNKQCWIV